MHTPTHTTSTAQVTYLEAFSYSTLQSLHSQILIAPPLSVSFSLSSFFLSQPLDHGDLRSFTFQEIFIESPL